MYKKITRAFTIVELIICIALIAIVASIALPYFHEYRSKQEAKNIPIKLAMKVLSRKIRKKRRNKNKAINWMVLENSATSL